MFTTNYHLGTNELIKDYLEAKGMSQKEFAIRLGMSEKHISKLLAGEVVLSQEMALLLERIFELSAETWLAYDANYHLFLTKQKKTEQCQDMDCGQKLKDFQYTELKKRKWVSGIGVTEAEKLDEVLSLLKVKAIEDFENYIAFKLKSALFKDDGYEEAALALWMARCQQRLEKKPLLKPYSEKELEKQLVEIRRLCIEIDASVFHKIESILNECGVYFIIEEALPNTKIRGVVTWFNDRPAIQLTFRFKTLDNFWFTFFHEIAHLLKHFKKSNWILDSEKTGDSIMEAEADFYALNYLIPQASYDLFVKARAFSQPQIIKFADINNVDPSIVAGRLAHDQHIGFPEYNKYRQAYDFERIK